MPEDDRDPITHVREARTEAGRRELQDLRRFVETLSLPHEVDTVVLKGHILIEELLRKLVEKKLGVTFKNKDVEVPFSFHHWRILAKTAYANSESLKSVWPAAKNLNAVRNQLAHKAAPQVTQKIDEFIKYTQDQLDDEFSRDFVSSLQGVDRLRVAVGWVRSQLSMELHSTGLDPDEHLGPIDRDEVERRVGLDENDSES